MTARVALRPPACAALALVLACGCGLPAQRGAAQPLDPPTPDGSRFPALHAASDGTLYLNWVEVQDGAPTLLQLAAFDGQRWTETRTIASDPAMFVNWADFPAVVEAPPGGLAAAWLAHHGPEPEANDAWLSRSADGGRQWSARVRSHDDGTATEHGFVSLVAEADGSMGVVWLDGRAMDRGAGDTMQLMYRRWAADGLGPETVLDADVCTCCQTSAARDGDDLFVAYRDHTAGSIRDIGLARRLDGRWLAPHPVHEDDWHIAGCPVNGPAVRAAAGRVAVAWFTAAGEQPRVLVAFSTDRGETFGEPVRVDTGRPLGRVDLALDGRGAAWVSWIERRGPQAEALLRRVNPDRSADAPQRVGPADAGRASGFPRIARVGERIYVAWTEAGPPPHVRLAALAIPPPHEVR